MELSNLINSIGLVTDIIGALLMFYYSPITTFYTHIYNFGEEEKLKEKANKINKYVKIGAYLLFTGFTLQLISNFIK